MRLVPLIVILMPMVAMTVPLCFSVYISSSDIDECTSGNDTCHINATCINTVGSYDCECLPGFMVDRFNCSINTVLT